MRRRDRGRTVNVQLADGSTITGTLDRAGWWTVRLVDAASLPSQYSQPAPIDGTVVIPRTSILWAQVV